MHHKSGEITFFNSFRKRVLSSTVSFLIIWTACVFEHLSLLLSVAFGKRLLYRLYDVSNFKIEWPRHLIHFIQITSVVRLMRLMKLKSVNQIQLNQSILIFLGLFPYLFSECNMKYYQRLFRHTRMCVHENTPVWTQSILKLEEKCKFILFIFIFLFKLTLRSVQPLSGWTAS